MHGSRPDSHAFSAAQVEEILASLPDPFFALDEDGRFVFVNEPARRYSPRLSDDALGRHVSEVLTQEHAERFRDLVTRVLQAGEVLSWTEHLPGGALDPQDRWLDVRAFPSAGGVAVHFRDVSEHHRALVSAKDSERRFRSLVEASSEIVWSASARGDFVSGQPAWSAFTGQSEAEQLGRGWLDAVHPDDRPRVSAAWQQAVRSQEPHEAQYRLRRHDGAFRTVHVRAVPVMDGDGRVREWLGTHRDVTRLTQAEQELRSLNEVLRRRVQAGTDALQDLHRFTTLLLEAAGEGVLGIDRSGVVQFANPAAARMTGHTVPELEGAVQHQLVHHTRADGSPYPPQECLIFLTAHDGVERRVSDEVFWRKDGTSFPVEYVATPLRDARGDPTGAVVMFRDITDQRANELALRDAVSELQRSNRDLEQFAYVASHDLQEPLRTVGSYTQLIARRYEAQLDEQGQQFMRMVLEGVVRMRRLINDLLTFARLGRDTPERMNTDLSRVARAAVEELGVTLSEQDAQVEVGELPVVYGDPLQLQQVLTNLIGNAVKFRRPDEAPHVRLSSEPSGDGWVVRVEDNGIGIDAGYRERIFEVFQRLHRRDQYPGTGIGLAICKRIIEQHGGRIWVEAGPRGGSAFHFTLPARTRGGDS